MLRDILLHTSQGIRTLNRRVLSYTVKLMFLLVTPAAVLLAPVAPMAAEAEVCGEDVEQCEECIEVSERRRLRHRKRLRTIDFARPSKKPALTASAVGLFQASHGVQTTQLVPLRSLDILADCNLSN